MNVHARRSVDAGTGKQNCGCSSACGDRTSLGAFYELRPVQGNNNKASVWSCWASKSSMWGVVSSPLTLILAQDISRVAW